MQEEGERRTGIRAEAEIDQVGPGLRDEALILIVWRHARLRLVREHRLGGLLHPLPP